jgi:hypothetical protein
MRLLKDDVKWVGSICFFFTKAKSSNKDSYVLFWNKDKYVFCKYFREFNTVLKYLLKKYFLKVLFITYHIFSYQNIYPPSPTFFSPLEFLFFPLILNFGTRFPDFIFWIRTSEHIFQKICRIWTKNISENVFRNFYSKANQYFGGLKRGVEGERKIHKMGHMFLYPCPLL